MLGRVRRFLAIALFVVPAFGQNNRSAVSLNGSDLNSCTPAAPCRSFAVAESKTLDGGEIIAIDSAGYGPFTIDRSITVSGAPGVHAAITATSGSGISVLTGAGQTRVVIRNLVLIGNGGTTGISTGTSAIVRILGCVIRGFSTAGVDSGGTTLIESSAIMDNTPGTGVRFANGTLSGAVRAALSNSSVEGNGTGLAVFEAVSAIVRNSLITGNGLGATAVSTTDNMNSDLMLDGCTIAHSVADGVQSYATGTNNRANVILSANVVAYNARGGEIVGNGGIYSFYTNRFVGNGIDGGPFSLAVPMQ